MAKARIIIHSRNTAADAIDAESKTYAATPRGARQAWRELNSLRDHYARMGRGVGRVVSAYIGDKNITDDIDMAFTLRFPGDTDRDINWGFLDA